MITAETQYITYDDYSSRVDVDQFRAALDGDQELRLAAQSRGINEAKDYLRGHFDIDDIFRRKGEDRHATLVDRIVDLVLYHAFCRVDPRKGPGMRKTLYRDALKWFEDVRAGKIDAGLPRIIREDGTKPTLSSIRISSNAEKLTHDY